MALRPPVRQFLDQVALGPNVDFQHLNEPGAIRAYLTEARKPIARATAESIASIEERHVGDDNIRVRIYRPDASGELPCLLYFHGGGWVIGDLEMHDDTCRIVANLASCMVVSVEYRLAPEHPYPVPLDDCWSVLLWVQDNLHRWGWDGKSLGVAGTSSGGNLAAATALRARDAGLTLALQVLLYPALDSRMGTASWQGVGAGYFLSADQMDWYWRQYAPRSSDRHRPEVSLSELENFIGLAPAIILTAEYDPLRDEAEVYAQDLRRAGVSTRLWRATGQIHGFLSLVPLASLNEVQEIKRALGHAISAHFETTAPDATDGDLVTAPSAVVEL